MKNSDIVIKDGYLDTSIFQSSNEIRNFTSSNPTSLWNILDYLKKTTGTEWTTLCLKSALSNKRIPEKLAIFLIEKDEFVYGPLANIDQVDNLAYKAYDQLKRIIEQPKGKRQDAKSILVLSRDICDFDYFIPDNTNGKNLVAPSIIFSNFIQNQNTAQDPQKDLLNDNFSRYLDKDTPNINYYTKEFLTLARMTCIDKICPTQYAEPLDEQQS